MSRSEPSSGSRKLELAITVVMAFVLVLVAIKPFYVWFIDDNLDGSWVAATIDAQRRHLAFGTEFIFTSGPLSSLYTRNFAFELNHLVRWVNLALLMFLTAFFVLVRNGPTRWSDIVRISLAAIVFFLVADYVSLDALLMFAGYAATYLLVKKGPGAPFWIGILGLVICGAYANAKLSILFYVLPACLVADVAFVYWKRVPLATVAFLVSVGVFFVSSGQALPDVLAYIVSGFDVTQGYAQAMALYHNEQYLIAWVLFAILLVGLKAWQWKVEFADTGRLLNPTGFEMVLLTGLLFVTMKQGFVRSDLHLAQSWYMLIFVAWIDLLDRRPGFHHLTANLSCALLVGAATTVSYAIASERDNWRHIYPSTGYRILTSQLTSLANYLQNPGLAQQQLEERAEQQRQKIISRFPLPDVDGSLDTIGHNQAAVVAHGLDYRPRPSVQEYNTYTSALVEKNLHFFSGDRAPDFLLFSPGSIDGRHPAAAEGPIWPTLMRRYQPEALVDDQVLMKLRQHPLQGLSGDPESITVSLGEWFDAPRDGVLLFKLEVQQSLLGRLMSFLLKPPLLNLEIEYEGHPKPESFRLIRQVAAKGMLISPYVQNTTDFLGLIAEEGYPSRQAKRVRVNTSEFGRSGYLKKVRVSFELLDLSEVREINRSLPVIRDALQPVRNIRPLLLANAFDPPHFQMADGSGLFLHAPKSLAIETGGKAWLSVKYSMMERTYLEGDTDGACLQVRDVDSSDILFRQCLDPKTDLRHRGEQQFSLRVEGRRRLELVTDCKTQCAWDWLRITESLLTDSPGPAVAEAGGVNSDIAPLLKYNGLNPPWIYLFEDGLFVHAPGKLRMNTEGASELRITFGMTEKAISEGDGDGFCLVVRNHATGRALAEKCLDPERNPQDRGDQKIRAALNGSPEIEIVGDCKASCNWDWMYFKHVELGDAS